MKLQKLIKEKLVEMAVNDEIPMDMNELDESVFDSVVKGVDDYIVNIMDNYIEDHIISLIDNYIANHLRVSLEAIPMLATMKLKLSLTLQGDEISNDIAYL
jgi:hypothetical protein